MRHFIQERTVSPPSISSKCHEEGCKARTNEGKPYCPDHVLRITRAKALNDRLTLSEEEILAVMERGSEAVDLDGLIVEELLAGIDQAGKITFHRLVKDRVFLLNAHNTSRADHKTADAFLKRLHDEDLVFIGLTARGTDVVTLTPKGLKVRRGG